MGAVTAVRRSFPGYFFYKVGTTIEVWEEKPTYDEGRVLYGNCYHDVIEK
jgi:hypothetical protein